MDKSNLQERKVIYMNNWKSIWEKRRADLVVKEDVFEMFCELKRADGFDTQEVSGYYEAFFEQWEKMNEKIKAGCRKIPESVYEVGCGSGVNLFLFHEISKVDKLGGLDYSKVLVEIAKKVVKSKDIACAEAKELLAAPKYDVVLADSVFQYFQNTDYGMNVLQKMFEKANQMVVITEIHDLAKQEEHLNYRRSVVENYDEHYKGLDKTFYMREMFIKFANEHGCRYEIIEPENKLYWNNKYVFDFYLYK